MYKIFLIYNESLKKPVKAFMTKSSLEAIAYFYEYLKTTKKTTLYDMYILTCVAETTNGKDIKIKNTIIKYSTPVMQRELNNHEALQLKIDKKLKEIQEIEKRIQERKTYKMTQEEMIKEVFGGNYV